MWEQVVGFNLAKAGNKSGHCLQNTRLGFGIPAVFDSAWQAWNNTEQHRDRNIPLGVDVPLFYDYTDSKGNRDGHVNVRLANTTVWSDGKVYADLGTFERSFSNVHFVGWGESLNRVRIIKEETDVIPDADNYYGRYGVKLAQQVRGRTLTRAEFRKHLVGRTDLQAVEILSDDPEADMAQHWQDVGKTAVKDRWDTQIYDLQAQVKALNSRPTQEQLNAAKEQADKLAEQVKVLEEQKSADTELLDNAGNWLSKLINRLFKKG